MCLHNNISSIPSTLLYLCMHAGYDHTQVLDGYRKVCEALPARIALDGFVNLLHPQPYISAIEPNKDQMTI